MHIAPDRPESAQFILIYPKIPLASPYQENRAARKYFQKN